ncbi:ABC-three component system protein [Aliivibrio logei]|uniref:ABC-three component system protein n=1 Tax=Aliivibrio logei TaxID=688 RepID=UPI00039EDFF1|nr:ABC-three component system protein [Aliivibrio logei]
MTSQNADAEERLPHTAISSYSGYIYQGKIALLHCLNLIQEQPEESRQLELRLENIDDFAIHHEDGSCKSLHQVKAKKGKRFSNYQSDIEQQQGVSQSYPNSDVFFHTSLPLIAIPDGFEHTFTPVRFYEYLNIDDEVINHCHLEDVDAFIEHQTKKVYQELLPTELYKVSSEYLRKSRQYLEDIVVKHVIDIHREIQETHTPGVTDRHIAARRSIPFEQFYVILRENLNQLAQNESYFHYLLLKDSGTYFHEYCLDINDNNTLLKLNFYLSKINRLDSTGLTKFIRSILPHRKAGFSNIKQYKDNSFNNDDFKKGLFKVLEQLKLSSFDDSSILPSFFFWKNGDDYLYPTAIRESQDDVHDISKEIIESAMENNVNFLFESGMLINRQINCPSIFSAIAVGSQADYEDEFESNKINCFKNVSLISLKDAEELIND